MRAVVYQEPHRVTVEEVPKPTIQDPNDIILKVTSSGICGSDMHMYEGRTAAEPGMVLGHEILGIVDEVGSDVKTLKEGDRVVLPFNIGCGICKDCEKGYPNACLIANPHGVGAGYGYVGMGEERGGQAEYVHVPFADYNALKLPGTPFDELEEDYLLLSDVLPTAWHALELAHFAPGDIVTIYGAGPVGLLTAMSARHRGTEYVFVVDCVPERLELAATTGAIPINFDEGPSVEQIRERVRNDDQLQARKRAGEEKIDDIVYGIDAVGYEAKDEKDRTRDNPSQVFDNLVELLDPTGHIGIIGVYLPQDPGGVDDMAREGRYTLSLGKAWTKGLTIGTGQTPVKRYNRELRDLVSTGKLEPRMIVSHQIHIEDAPEAYEKFDAKADGYTKVIIQFKENFESPEPEKYLPPPEEA